MEEIDLISLHTAAPETAIAFLVRHLARGGHFGQTDPTEVKRAVLRREQLGSTAIGHGVAIPHARLSGIPLPVAVVGRCVVPIAWDSPDGNPVMVVCLVIGPNSPSMLPLLDHAVQALKQAGE